MVNTDEMQFSFVHGKLPLTTWILGSCAKEGLMVELKEPRGNGLRVIKGMYSNAQGRVRVNGQYSEFGMGVGVHQGSVLSSLLLILVLEALSHEFRLYIPVTTLHLSIVAKKTFYCNDHTITEFGIADKNSSTAYVILYELIDTWFLDSNRGVGVWSLSWRWHILSIPFTTGRATSTETCGLDDVFPPDDLGSRQKLCVNNNNYIYIYIYAFLIWVL